MVEWEPGRGHRHEGSPPGEDQDADRPTVLVEPEAEVGEDAEFARAMELGREVMNHHRAVLATLAK